MVNILDNPAFWEEVKRVNKEAFLNREAGKFYQ